MAGIYLALGSNLGDRQAYLDEAVRRLHEVMTVVAVSRFHKSKPQPPADGPDYLNGACRVDTGLSPLQLLYVVKGIEVLMGRTAGPRWSPRVIDIGVALYNEEVIDTPELVVPHAMLTQRDFVLRPLVELDPTLRLPVTGIPLANYLRDLS
jgi:2-amino-4-hydroxy-6-hydroxymethyldihydropteridine diphosphokinase